MSMRIGLCGAHRVGKSTLAKAFVDTPFASEFDFEFRALNSIPIFERHGVTARDEIEPRLRMTIQNEILNAGIELWSKPGNFITDRTPLDMIAYTEHSTRKWREIQPDVAGYRARALKAHLEFFDHAIQILPGIKIVDEPGKAAPDPWLIDILTEKIKWRGSKLPGAFEQLRFVIMSPQITNLDIRVRWVQTFVHRVMHATC